MIQEEVKLYMTEDLTQKSKWLRREILEMCCKAGVGHIASSFSCVEIIVSLYYGGILNYNSQNPKWDGRDRFILSKGHAGVALYPILADLGFFPKAEIDNFCHGGILGGHPDIQIPGIEITSGSLGHGLGIGVGLALSAIMDNKKFRTYILVGDGELEEGSTWEAIMFAGHHMLSNLTVIVDYNQYQCVGKTEDTIDLHPLAAKFANFGWEYQVVDGHNLNDLKQALSYSSKAYPNCVIAKTIKGKGISFMEGNPLAHSMIPLGEKLVQARDELCK